MDKLTPDAIAAIVDAVKRGSSSHHQTQMWVVSAALAQFNRDIAGSPEEIEISYGTFTGDCIKVINRIHQ